MTAINGLGGSSYQQPTQTQRTQTTNETNGIMGKDDYMKLFLASLKYQDPMAPLETKDMMSQMSQLTMVESVSNLSDTVEDLQGMINGNPLEKGVNFLGKEVAGITSEGKQLSGEVSEISVDNEGILELFVENEFIKINSVNRVANYQLYDKFQF